jgi:Transposase, Mutator family
MFSETHANGFRGRTQRTMALDQSALLEVLEALKAAEVDDQIRQAAETIYQALIEAELASVIGALPHERTGARTGHRNGHRPRVLASTAGDLELRILKLRTGSFFASLLERRRRVDQSGWGAYGGGLPRLTADQNAGATGERYGSGQRFWNSRHPGPQLSDQTVETPGPGRSRTSEVLKLPRSRFLAVFDRTQQ